MKIYVSTPNGPVFDGEVNYIVCKGQDGEYAILKNHVPSVSLISEGHVKIVGSSTQFAVVVNAVVEFKDNVANILAQESEIDSSIDGAKSKLEASRKARQNENRRKDADLTQVENDLRKNIKASKAGSL